MNDSSTGGYLTPSVASPPLEDAELDAILQQVIVGVSGLPGNMVRPRWQPVVPKQPDPSANWCAIGITDIWPDDNPAFVHAGNFLGGVVLADGTPVNAGTDPVNYNDTNGRDTSLRHEKIEMLCSFYGPNGMRYAAQTRDGLYIPQNQEQLGLNDMAFIDAGVIRPAPELVNQQWIRRYDMTITLRRKVTRTYQILNILTAGAAVEASTPLTATIDVKQ